ncbi:hypothetical protein QJS04_geneDACA001707 [Acorus gramineus]|uniref:Uncharacterized protein n=1 Tax=Acorus gramineus TaxID=55184 RepID=A0AAV9BGS8_ACOGR|nr:hypothetical protein QJS04_geneDACA001707 [Acorus gramineus]
MDSSSSSSSDGDAEWRAAIDSIASSAVVFPTKSVSEHRGDGDRPMGTSRGPNLYQLKAQKLLEGILDKSLVMVKDPIPCSDENPQENEVGIRLFQNAPSGIIFDPIDETQPIRRRPRILPGEEVDEKSKKFKRQIICVAVDGYDIMAAAKHACERSFAKFEAKNAAAEAAAKREEERVAKLKKLRGEKWLPSIAREMKTAKLQDDVVQRK